MSSEAVQIVCTLLGGLAMFIFGMNMMSDGLQKAAGERMKSILAMLTRNPLLGMLAGALCTAVLQSSSATTVMAIGFVSAGLMKLPQAISVILGANIGTTITAQLIAFKIGDYAWIILFVGFIMYFFLKKHEHIAQIGQVIFAFGMLFVGINTMGEVMKPLAASPVFADMMLRVQDVPVLGVVLGAAMTVVVQSSSATIAVLQNLASTATVAGHSVLGLQGALPILFGDNIGTTITAMLAAIGGSLNAKRTAAAHVVFNLSGTIIWIWFIPWISKFVAYISPKGPEIEVISRQIANAHTLFNVVNALIWLPLIWLLVKIVMKILPGKDKVVGPEVPVYLDRQVLGHPVMAIHLAVQELDRIYGYCKEILRYSKDSFFEDTKVAAEKGRETETLINRLHQETSDYLASILASDSATTEQTQSISRLMKVSADLEHIGDYCINIIELAEEKNRQSYWYSDVAMDEISTFYEAANQMVDDSRVAIQRGNLNKAHLVLEEEDSMNVLEDTLRKGHMERLNNNECSPAFTVTFTETIHNLEKIGDCCKNIAEAVIDNKGSQAGWYSENVDPETEPIV